MIDFIQNIPIERLRHHPDNPRKALGDLSELAESIRVNGILQNLTVVPADPDREPDAKKKKLMWVVIGNRRFEAAKLAGLDAVPCTVSDMDHKTQVSTMLTENMQRADLTVYEQAKGFQMMMDLGFDEKAISEETGFSRTTVRRRLKMAEMDDDALKAACSGEHERQITLADFEKLSQIEDLDTRNKLLKDIGENGFEWRIRSTLQEQRAKAALPDALAALQEAGIEALPKGKEYSGEYNRLYQSTVILSDWEKGNPLIPETEKQLYYSLSGNKYIYFFVKAEQIIRPAESPEEKEMRKRIEETWKRIDADAETARQMRREFADSIPVNLKKLPDLMKALITATVLNEINYITNDIDVMFSPEESADREEAMAYALAKIQSMPISEWSKVVRGFFDANGVDNRYHSGYKGRMPEHRKSILLDCYYDWLCANGYQMSEAEIQMRDGTHPSFGKEAAEDDQ